MKRLEFLSLLAVCCVLSLTRSVSGSGHDFEINTFIGVQNWFESGSGSLGLKMPGYAAADGKLGPQFNTVYSCEPKEIDGQSRTVSILSDGVTNEILYEGWLDWKVLAPGYSVHGTLTVENTVTTHVALEEQEVKLSSQKITIDGAEAEFPLRLRPGKHTISIDLMR